MIRHLHEDDAPAYVALRREALLQAPLAFTASPNDDVVTSIDDARNLLRQAPTAVVIGAFQDRLVGVVGVYRDRHAKASHKLHLWGLYITPDQRGQGLGAALLERALQHARAVSGVEWIHLSVSSAAPEAQRLYERAGFRVWGSEPDALRHQGQSVTEYHMALQLEEVASQARRVRSR